MLAPRRSFLLSCVYLTFIPPPRFPCYNHVMDKNRFSQFEERIQALIEGGFARLFAGRLQPREVALRLARAMEDEADLDETGSLAAPNRYIVLLHPDDHAALLAAQPDLAVTLADHLVLLARESDLRLDVPPEVTLAPDRAIALHAVSVQARHVEAARQTTQMMMVSRENTNGAPPGETSPLPHAFLVVDGARYVPLEHTVINIGRRRDNTIVLDDRRISRQHCQLRFRFGEFVLYDLGSRGGTFVNDARVAECVLRPGDVISLAGVTLVYVVEDDSEPDKTSGGDTQAYITPDRNGES
jgi:hypothetical protein